MTTSQHNALIIGKSRLVLDETVAELERIGFAAAATNRFDEDITELFDVSLLDVVVFGGQVPPDRKAELKAKIIAINPSVIFVQGLAGIPGLIVQQVLEAVGAQNGTGPESEATFDADTRTLHLALREPEQVTVTAWWQTSFVPPDPRSTSLVLHDDLLAAGDHAFPVPADVPLRAAFTVVAIGSRVRTFDVGNAASVRAGGPDAVPGPAPLRAGGRT